MVNNAYRIIQQQAVPICICFLGLLFLAFYPSKSINVDEYNYVENSKLLLQGDLRQSCDPYLDGHFRVGDYCIFKYNVGTSMLLTPAVVVSERLVFVVTFLHFIASIYLFYLLLKQLQLNTIFTYLFAFYPAFVYSSRTVLSETFAVTYILLAILLLLKIFQSYRLILALLAGTSVGLAVMIRYTNAIPLVIFVLLLCLINYKRLGRRQLMLTLLTVAIAGVPWFFLFVKVNDYLYGAPLRSGYSISGEDVFLLSKFASQIWSYLGVLMLIYPGMLVAVLFVKNKLKWLLFLPFAATLAMYASSINSLFQGELVDFVIGTRFLSPVAPLLLIIYAMWLNRYADYKYFKPLAVVSITGLIISALIITVLHHRFLTN